MRKINRNGFTLVELLATLVILGLLMGVAAPNILGVISKNRNITYVEDAQKLVSRAEYVLRSDPKITKPANGSCVGFTLGYLDNSEFHNTPYGGKYYANYSLVIVHRQLGEYKYYVQLVEALPKKKGSGDNSEEGSGEGKANTSDRGIELIDVDTLANSKPGQYIKNMQDLGNLINLSSETRKSGSVTDSVVGCTFTNQNVYSDDITYEKASAVITNNPNIKKDEDTNNSGEGENPEG